jgi:N-acetyl sugar amidotransferase
MDTTDPDIVFDEQGVCNHCRLSDRILPLRVPAPQEARRRLAALVAKIKSSGRNREYDCVLGVSGGIDSSYLAVVAAELGLRPLAVHFDNGWDSELAVGNIERLLNRLGIDFFTYVVDWTEFRDLQLAFLRASTPDCEIPTDHAIFSVVRQIAVERGIRHVLSGTNLRTETHIPDAWSQGHADWRYIRDVHRRFGTQPLRTYPHRSRLRDLSYRFRVRYVELLNLMDYRREDAKALLESRFGWRDYGGKHHESVYTRFYQGYILPVKFGYDKRRAHLSSLICSHQIERAAALAALEQPVYTPEALRADREYVLKKLGLSAGQFDELMALPRRTIADFASYGSVRRTWYYRQARRAYRFVKYRVLPQPGGGGPGGTAAGSGGAT